jgi:hypothetical protein
MCSKIPLKKSSSGIQSRNSQPLVKEEATLSSSQIPTIWALPSAMWTQFIASHPAVLVCTLILSQCVPKGIFPSRHPSETFHEFLFNLTHATAPANSTFRDLITKIITGHVKIFGDSQCVVLSILLFLFISFKIPETPIWHAHSSTLYMTQAIILKGTPLT